MDPSAEEAGDSGIRGVDDGETRRVGPSPNDAPLAGDPDSDRAIGSMVMQRLFAHEPVTRRIGRFVVLDRIGRGGMGTVYAAYDEELDRKVAIKVLRTDRRARDEDRLRLQREAQAMRWASSTATSSPTTSCAPATGR